MTNIAPLRSDLDVLREKAKAYESELSGHLERVCEVMTRAGADGLAVNFSVPRNGYGKFIPDITISKVFP